MSLFQFNIPRHWRKNQESPWLCAAEDAGDSEWLLAASERSRSHTAPCVRCPACEQQAVAPGRRESAHSTEHWSTCSAVWIFWWLSSPPSKAGSLQHSSTCHRTISGSAFSLWVLLKPLNFQVSIFYQRDKNLLEILTEQTRTQSASKCCHALGHLQHFINHNTTNIHLLQD